MATTIHDSVGKLDDETWLDLLIRSLEHRVVDGVELPGFPTDATQRITNARAGADTLRHASQFYRIAREMLAGLGAPLRPDSRVLDYGCGWGRIARFFYKDVAESNVYGIDVNPVLIDACEATMPPGRFFLVDPDGRLPFPDNHFDVVWANSVLSHLNERLHVHAVSEIVRVLKPGGASLLTIIDEKSFDKARSAANPRGAEMFSSLGDVDEVKARVRSGELLWGSWGYSGALDEYGITIVPLEWAKERWPGLDYRDVRRDYGQAVVLSVKI